MHARIVDASLSPRRAFGEATLTRSNGIVLALAILAVSVGTSVFAIHRYLGFHPGGTLYNLDNAWGPLVHSLRETGEYGMCKQYVEDKAFWEYFWGDQLTCFTAHRLPFIGYFLTLLSYVSANLYFASIVKNVLFYSISTYTLLRVSTEYNVYLLGIGLASVALFLVPMNASVAAALASEEGYIYHLLPLLFVLLFLVRIRTNGDLVAVAAIVGILILTKSSLFLICALAAVVPLLPAAASPTPGSKRRGWLHGLPACVALAAILGWGLFVASHTGRFAIGPEMSSINGLNFYKGNNPYVELYYPLLHLDREDYDGVTKPDIPVADEWQADDYYRGMALNFIREHPAIALRMLLARLRVAFLSIEQVGIFPEAGHTPGIAVSMIPTRLIFLVSVIVAVVGAYRSRDTFSRRAAYGFLGLIILFSAPYLAAFVWYRHMMPIYATAVFYLLANYGGVRRASLNPLRSMQCTVEPSRLGRSEAK